MGCGQCIRVRDYPSRVTAVYHESMQEEYFSPEQSSDENTKTLKQTSSCLSIVIGKKDDSINILPISNCFGKKQIFSGSRQRLQELPEPNQLPPTQVQASASSSRSYDESRENTPCVTTILGTYSEIWDEIFCDEIEFLEEVFYDNTFRILSCEPDQAERLKRVMDYLDLNESWAFSSKNKKRMFVSNVLLLFKAYLPRGDGESDSCSERKMPAICLWNWWRYYVEEMLSRYSSMFKSGESGSGVEMIVNKLLPENEYPSDDINQLRMKVVKQIWTLWELEINQIKKNLREIFDVSICPISGEEDQQDFLNNYTKRSFLPNLLRIFIEILWFINSHLSVIKNNWQKASLSGVSHHYGDMTDDTTHARISQNLLNLKTLSLTVNLSALPTHRRRNSDPGNAATFGNTDVVSSEMPRNSLNFMPGIDMNYLHDPKHNVHRRYKTQRMSLNSESSVTKNENSKNYDATLHSGSPRSVRNNLATLGSEAYGSYSMLQNGSRDYFPGLEVVGADTQLKISSSATTSKSGTEPVDAVAKMQSYQQKRDLELKSLPLLPPKYSANRSW